MSSTTSREGGGRGASFLAGLGWADLVRRLWARIQEHEILMRSAAAAYYGLSAVVPFLALLVTLAVHVAPDVTGAPHERGGAAGMTVEEFRRVLQRALPSEAYEVVANEIARIQKQPPIGLLSVGLLVTLWLASSFYSALIDAMNRIKGVIETRSYLRLTLTAIMLTVIQLVIMLGALFVLVVWPHLSSVLRGGLPEDLGRAAFGWSVAAACVLLSLDVILYLGPNARQRWRWVTPGGAGGTVVLLLACLLLRLYVQHLGSYGKTYGSLAGVLLLAFWFWIGTLIVLVSVQLDQVIIDERLSASEGREGRAPVQAVGQID